MVRILGRGVRGGRGLSQLLLCNDEAPPECKMGNICRGHIQGRQDKQWGGAGDNQGVA